MDIDFDLFHGSINNGWGFSFRKSQLFRFDKYISMIKAQGGVSGDMLEIGCSTGFFTYNYLGKISNLNIKAIDISQVAITKAKQRYRNIDFSVASLPRTDFSDGSFDLVTAIEILYYLSQTDQVKSMQEMARILKDGGFILVSVNIGEKPYFSLSEIKELVEAKFEIISEDALYIKSYYKHVETKIWQILEIFSSYKKYNVKPNDTFLRHFVKNTLNLFVRNKIVFYSIGAVIRGSLKLTLYIMPISTIDKISKFIRGQSEMSVYMALAKKRK